MESTEDSTSRSCTVIQPPKYSRYRSVRLAAAREAQAASPSSSQDALAPSPKGGDAVKQSMSRYRKARPGQTPAKLAGSASSLSDNTRPIHQPLGSNVYGSQFPTSSQFPETSATEFGRSGFPSEARTAKASTPAPYYETHGLQGHSASMQSGQGRGQSELPARYRSANAWEADDRAVTANGQHSNRQEQRREEENRALASDYRTSQSPSPPRSPQQHLLRKNPPSTHRPSPSHEMAFHTAALGTVSKQKKIVSVSKDMISAPMPMGLVSQGAALGFDTTIQESNAAVSPIEFPFPDYDIPDSESDVSRDTLAGFDAPVSSINTKERSVRVRYKGNSMSLPVTPSTTPQDIVKDAYNYLGGMDADVKVLESFKALGLERRLRPYEHIRDVLNSWNQDETNLLNIVPSYMNNEYDRADDKVSIERPGEISVYMYHSRKSSSWDKRWITLRPDGQVLHSKHPISELSSSSEAQKLCHLSDFDIYIPTQRETRRLKAPKKFVLAIKSQQKSSMFLTQTDYAHFFAVKENAVAQAWYDAVRSWRSWYMVNTLGLGDQASKTEKRHSYHETPNVRPSHKHSKSTVQRPTTAKTVQRTTHIKSFSTHIPKGGIIQKAAQTSSNEDIFRSSGLLGRTYTQKKADYIYSGGESVPSPTKPKAQNSSLHSLAQLMEPQQALKPGNDQVPSGDDRICAWRDQVLSTEHAGLVAAATNPASTMPFTFPAAVLVAPTHNTLLARAGTQRTTRGPGRLRATTMTGAGTEGMPLIDLGTDPTHDVPFTGGLLSTAAPGQGERQQGRGVRTGDRAAREPLLDLQTESLWAKGSLLEGMVREQGDDHLIVVDRSKHPEGTLMKTGEAAA